MSDLITIDDLLNHVARDELTQVAGVGSFNSPEGRDLDEVKINSAIQFASDMMKGYLGKRYPSVMEMNPVDTPSLLKGYLADVVRHRLRSRSGNRNTTSDEVDTRFKDARDWMREVSRGLVNVALGDSDADMQASNAGAANPAGTVKAIIPAARAPHILDGYSS